MIATTTTTTTATFYHNTNGAGWATLATGEFVEFGGAGVVPFSAWCRKAGVSPTTVSQSNGSTRRRPAAYHEPLNTVETATLTEAQVGSLREFAAQVAARELALAGLAPQATFGYLGYWTNLGYEVW